MSRFEVSTQQMYRSVSALTEKSCTLKTKIAELLTMQEQLSSQWSGDASSAFSAAFQDDYAKWISFTRVLDNYIQTLRQIAGLYDDAEARNLETIASRSGSYPGNAVIHGGLNNITVNALYAAPNILCGDQLIKLKDMSF